MLMKHYLDCKAQWSHLELSLGNGLIRRVWTIDNGLLRNSALYNETTGKQLLLEPSREPSPAPDFAVREACIKTEISADVHDPGTREQPSLIVRVRSSYASYVLTTVLRIFPCNAAISSLLETEELGDAAVGNSHVHQEDSSLQGGIEQDDKQPAAGLTTNVNELFQLNHVHHKLSIVTLMDNTDAKDNLVDIRTDLLTVSSSYEYRANLFYIEDQLSGDGILFLKEAPLPHARPNDADATDSPDLLVHTGRFTFCGLGGGMTPTRSSYPLTTIVYNGGCTERIRALQNYQRCYRDYRPELDLIIWPCTWGDRSRDGKVGEAYLMQELETARELGMDFLYFTDGWQKGVSSNSVIPGGIWDNQWSVDGYWQINPVRYPNGFEPFVRKAGEYGIQFGAWYNPDKTGDYANWRRDADVIIELYRKYAFSIFKFDGVEFRTKRGETNLLKAMHAIAEETGGAVSIEIDITAGVRTGYFSAMPYGYLFLENRYTDWHKYWPHCTLRNLWQLSQFVDPRRLRMEFLNNERNAHLYQDDPLAPHCYPADYLFATVMFALPLAWFEMGGLSETYKEQLKSIIGPYKQHRAKLMEGNVYPIGDTPDGLSWTGFASVLPGAGYGYVLIFREWNSSDRHSFKLDALQPGRYGFERLSGSGEASFEAVIDASREIVLSLPRRQSYAWYRFELIG